LKRVKTLQQILIDMKKYIKSKLPIEVVRSIVEFRYNNFPGKIINDWKKQGCPIPPPPVVKQKLIRDTQKQYGYNILVETGTYLGYMVSAQKRNFKKIFSIELDHKLHERAVRKFGSRKNIKLIQGDSGEKLADVTKEINEPAIFWLDGHYSGGFTAKGESNCPIWKELDIVFSNRNDHIILIDDARDFKGENDYPTVEEVKTYIKAKNPNYTVFVENDIIIARL
jgi:hypothetical protein